MAKDMSTMVGDDMEMPEIDVGQYLADVPDHGDPFDLQLPALRASMPRAQSNFEAETAAEGSRAPVAQPPRTAWNTPPPNCEWSA